MKAHIPHKQQSSSIRTAGDDPVDYMDEDRELAYDDIPQNNFYVPVSGGVQNPLSNGVNLTSVNHQSSYPAQEDPNHNDYAQEGDQENYYTSSSQGGGIDSLSKLMGGLSPRDFANLCVYGGKKQANFNFVAKQPFNTATHDLQTNSRESHREFGKEIKNVNTKNVSMTYQSVSDPNNYVPPSEYTIYAEKLYKSKLLSDDKKQGRIFEPKKGEEIILSHDNTKDVLQCNPTQEYIPAQKELCNRLYQEAEVFQQNREYKRIVKEQEQDENVLTFHPNQSHYASQDLGSMRPSMRLATSPEQMYEQELMLQKQLLVKVDMKREENQRKIAENLQEKPHISNKTKKMAENKLLKEGKYQVNLIDRLSEPKNIREKHEQSLEQVSGSIQKKPYQISISVQLPQRVKQVTDNLYEDAKRRLKTKQNMESVSLTSQGDFDAPNTRGSTLLNDGSSTFNRLVDNKQTLKATINRFIKDFTLTTAKVINYRDEDATLSYLELVEILKGLSFLPQNDDVNWFENRTQLNSPAYLAQKVWTQLNGPTARYILTRNLLVFLFAVLNVYVSKEIVPLVNKLHTYDSFRDHVPEPLIPDDRGNTQDSYNDEVRFGGSGNQKKMHDEDRDNFQLDIKLIGKIDAFQNFTIMEDEVIVIHKYYKQLYSNRLAYEKGTGNHRRAEKPGQENPSFQPVISEVSETLAQQKRIKLIDELKSQHPIDDEQIDINLLHNYQKYQSELEKIELTKKNEQKLLAECTFKPETKDFKGVAQKYHSKKQSQMRDENSGANQFTLQGGDSQSGIHRTIELYSLARPHNQKRDRQTREVQYEKECDQCTFTPDITPLRLNSPQHSKSNFGVVKGIDGSVNRIQQARIKKEVIKQISDKGSTTNLKRNNQIKSMVFDTNQKEVNARNRAQSPPMFPEGITNKKKNNSRAYQHMSDLDFKSDSQRIQRNDEASPEKHIDYFNNINQEQAAPVYSQIPVPNKLPAHTPSNTYGAGMPGFRNGLGLRNQANNHEEDRVPLLFVDVNIEDGKTQRIIVYDGDKSDELASRFAAEHGLDLSMKQRLKELLDMQINSLLTKIEEEPCSDDESNKNDDDDNQ